ncbi:hypothetical protein V6N12_005618 [Hibiscus sabdariffa]|uniref:B box-type domain-containing protein n=1 Tax=Hibiscus sabdariffa TaxID=183260 RepID=A0ABR2BAD7_9ROSI
MRPTHIAAVARRRFSFLAPSPPLLSLSLAAIMLFSSHLPRWLQVLLTEKFFNACIIHEDAKKNEKNIYCLDCCISICPNCLSPHSSHRLLQIRRYVYHDVIRLDDATKLMDCAFVQRKSDIHKPKATNKTVQRLRQLLQYLRQKPARPLSLLLSLLQEDGVSKFLFECNFLPLPEAGSEDGLVTPDSVLEPSASTKTSSGSGACGEVSLNSTATTEIVRKKRSSLKACRPTCPPTVSEVSGSLMNRRKKTPQRAPLY